MVLAMQDKQVFVFHDEGFRLDVTLGWGTAEMYCEAFAIMVVADVLAPNRRQAINNHHAVSSVTTDYANWYNSFHHVHILLQPLHK